MRALHWVIIGVSPLSCTPLRDLDAASRGGLVAASASPSSSAAVVATINGSTSGSPTSTSPSVASSSTVMSGATSPSVSVPSTPTLSAPSVASVGSAPGNSGSNDAGVAPPGSATFDSEAGTPISPTNDSGMGYPPGQDAPELPLDLPGTPVSGTFFVSSEAEWEVETGFEPTFEIKTPTASYWVVKPLGMIVSLQAADAEEPSQWIGYSSGFRPSRGVPSFKTFGAAEVMTTTLDEASQTPTHLRLNAETASGSWRLVYDFYPTHVTITINAAPSPYGFAFRGVIAGTVEEADRFGVAGGNAQSAVLSSVTDWMGPSEWVYMSDPALQRSLFMIQHMGDALTDRYQVRDNDSALISFGDGNLTQLPQRFSIGLVNSAAAEDVAERAAFVLDSIQ
jgi:hypothetical protein